MKRLVTILVVAFILVCSFAHAEEMETHNTKHFSYVVPKGWHKKESENSMTHYGKVIGSPVGGYIHVMEQEITEYISDEDELDAFYNGVANSVIGDSDFGFQIKNVEIDGRPGVLMLGILNSGNSTYDAAYIFLIADKYFFSQAMLNPEQSPEYLFESVEELAKSIQFIDNSKNVSEGSGALPDPRDYSGSVLQKMYQPYDYTAARNTPESYKGTSVYSSGWVFMKKILDDGWGYALFFENQSNQPVYMTLPPGSITEKGLEIGDNIEVYGVAQTLTETKPSYPVILTTMKIVNHGQ